MNNYPVIWGLCHKPFYGSLLNNHYNGQSDDFFRGSDGERDSSKAAGHENAQEPDGAATGTSTGVPNANARPAQVGVTNCVGEMALFFVCMAVV